MLSPVRKNAFIEFIGGRENTTCTLLNVGRRSTETTRQAAFKVPPVKFMYFIFFYTHMFGFCSVSEPPMNEKRLLLVAPLLRECVLKHTVVEISPS